MFRALKRWWNGRPDVCRCRQCKLSLAAELLAAEHARQAYLENRVLPTGGSSPAPPQGRYRVGVQGGCVVLDLENDSAAVVMHLDPADAWRLGEGLLDAAKQARDAGVKS